MLVCQTMWDWLSLCEPSLFLWCRMMPPRPTGGLVDTSRTPGERPPRGLAGLLFSYSVAVNTRTANTSQGNNTSTASSATPLNTAHSTKPVFGGQSSDVATTAFRSPPSAADTYVQSTSINWLYRAVGELHSAIGLSLLQARWSGTHYRLSFAIYLSVFMFFGALLRRYYSRDISASSAIEMYPWYCAI